MLRKGLCSNDPQNCTLADGKIELPYAGLNSICPECGSPLAALAATTTTGQSSMAPPPPATFKSEPVRPVQDRYDRSQDFDDPVPVSSSAMKLTQMVLVGAAIALLGFFAWRMFLQPRPVSTSQLEAPANVNSVGGAQIIQISPPQIRTVSVGTEARSAPGDAGSIIAQLGAGAILDVTGQVQVNGIDWLRITLPNDSSRSGFVRQDQMANMGDPALSISPLSPQDSLGAPSAPQTLGADVVGPVQALSPTTFYITSRRANIREDANASSAKLGSSEFSDPLTVVAQRSVGAATWYQVQLASGGLGWINGGLIATTPRATPTDAPPVSEDETAPKTPTKASDDTYGPTTETGKRDDQAALNAFGAGTTLRVDAQTANLRKVPGVAGNNVVESLPRDTLMSVEDVRIIEGVPWYRVTSPNRAQGWISGRTVVENR